MIGTEMSEFIITGCHANRANEASVALRHVATGAMVTVQQIPFSHDMRESDDEECDRIRQAAAKVAHAAVVFLMADSTKTTIIPETTSGAAPNSEPPIKRRDQS
jgi:hypothetical protein